MRIGWLLLFISFSSYSWDGCPGGVSLGYVTMATPLPVCLKYENSSKGGCIVKCQDVCVEMPLANTKGPVFTNGDACSISSGNPEGSGDGSGDGDGGPDAPGSGNSGSTAFPGWYNFEPVIGDSTGTSVSGTVAKLNKNLGKALGNLAGSSSTISRQVNEILGEAHRQTNASEGAVELLKEIREYNKLINSHTEGENLYSSRNEARMEEVLIHLRKMADSKGDTPPDGGIDDDELGKNYWDYKFNLLYGKLDEMNKGGLNSIQMLLGQMQDPIFGIEGALGANGMAGNINAMRATLEQISGKVGGSSGNTTGGTSGGSDLSSGYLKELIEVTGYMSEDVHSIKSALEGSGGNGNGEGQGEGSGIDYNQMPGSGDNPLAVQGGKYNSACQGKDCFFDVPAMQKKLDDANKSLTDKYTTISSDVQKVFTFSLSGSADPMECLDLFSHQGKTYSVCPPTGDYWQTLAAIMMFVFYFIALMIIFKR